MLWVNYNDDVHHILINSEDGTTACGKIVSTYGSDWLTKKNMHKVTCPICKSKMKELMTLEEL